MNERYYVPSKYRFYWPNRKICLYGPKLKNLRVLETGGEKKLDGKN